MKRFGSATVRHPGVQVRSDRAHAMLERSGELAAELVGGSREVIAGIGTQAGEGRADFR